MRQSCGTGGLSSTPTAGLRSHTRPTTSVARRSASATFDDFAAFIQDVQLAILEETEAVEKAQASAEIPAGTFLREPWERRAPGSDEPSRGLTAVLENGYVWEKAAASTSIICGRLSGERAASLSTHEAEYQEGEAYRACALSLVFHARSPVVPVLRGDVRLFELPERNEYWFGGGADLTPYFIYKEDCEEFHEFWRNACQEWARGGADDESASTPEGLRQRRLGDQMYAAMKRTCDKYFYIPARKEHRGVGGIFFDKFTDEVAAEYGSEGHPFVRFVEAVAEGFLPSYLPIVERRCGQDTEDMMRQWQLLRRGRYVEFNLLYDRGVRFGLAQLEKVMVSAPPLVAWQYRAADDRDSPGSCSALLDVLRRPEEWGFAEDEGELIEFLGEGRTVAGVLPRKTVMALRLCFRGIGVLVLREGTKCLEVLCHHRASTKSTYAGRWDMLVGGVPRPGEVTVEAAGRELGEELGIDANTCGGLHALGFDCDVQTDVVSCSCTPFACVVPMDQKVDLTDGEATEYEWRSVDDVQQAVEEDPTLWVESGLQVWNSIVTHGGADMALRMCRRSEDDS